MSNQPPAIMFECSVCCSELKETARMKKIVCMGCEYTVCSTCQKQYGKTDCMKCRARFSTQFAINCLGNKFATQTAKQNVLKELMILQKSELETVGELVEWTKAVREIQKHRRFGLNITIQNADGRYITELPPKPVRSNTGEVLCLCPVNDCRGRIIRDKCNICNTVVCTECLFLKTEGHVCDPNVVESVKDIRTTTKSCPSCSTLIHKTEGCDHMNCTNCGIHFSWENGTILSNSSNYHYRNRMIRQQFRDSDDAAEQLCAVSLEHDRIPESVLRELLASKSIVLDESIYENLYEVTKAVRHLKRTEYSEVIISKNSREKYDELQIKYAMNEITEKVWEQQVYKTHIKQQSYELIAGILHIYIANMDGIQSEIYNAAREDNITCEFLENIIVKMGRLCDIINNNIQEIHDEYDPTNNTILVIRKIGKNNIGYCSKHRIFKETSKSTVLENKVLSEKIPIELYPYQTEHVEILNRCLDGLHFAIDLSPLGTGKTYTAAKIFQIRQFPHIISISPPSVKTKWIEVNETYSLNCKHNLTYGEITGKRFLNPKCGYLIRNDYRVEVQQENGSSRMIDKYNYTVTNEFKTIAEEGLLLVIDEFQHLKNECAQTEACEVLIRCIYEMFKRGGKSRVLLLSGSPIDKHTQAVRLFKTLGIMQHDKIVSGYQYAGINEIEDYIQSTFKTTPRFSPNRNLFVETYHDKYIRTRVDQNNNIQLIQNAYRCEIYAYLLFLHVIKPNASSSMKLQEMQNTGITLNKYNGYFKLNNQQNQLKINAAIEELNKIEQLRIRIREHRRQTGDPTAGGIMAQMARALITIETSKIDTFHRLAKKELDTHENKKVVIGLNYNATITDLTELLKEYSPLILDGTKSTKQRGSILEKFQRNTSEYRVLIGNVAVISTGIDLDDKHGDFPRVCYISPNYNTIHIYQLGHRFLRGLDTKSNTDIYMVYSNNSYERRIIERLMQKGQVMKTVTQEQSDAGVVFPCDYEQYEEPDI